MAHSLTPKDVHAVMNLLVKQATGQQAITVVDASSFVSAANLVLETGVENTLNSLALVIGRTLIAVRPYKAKLMIINALNSGLYSNRLRKISFYSDETQEAGFFNTQTHEKNLYNGYDNGSNGGDSVSSMWTQKKKIPVELHMNGSNIYDHEITVYERQWKSAFRGEAEFADFLNGIMVEHQNDIESAKEAYNRMTILNKIAGTYAMSANMTGSVINLTQAYNQKHSTNYTSEELRTTYLDSFLAFFVTEFKNASDFMTERTAMYHWSPSKTVDGKVYDKLLRHTPKDRQRALLYSPLFTEAKANVFPSIFNPDYLDIGNYEGVSFWQSEQNRASINFLPAIVDTVTGAQKPADNAVNIPYVVGMLYDVDGVLVDYQLTETASTPLEAKKLYRNIYLHCAFNSIVDYTENTVIFIMAD